MMYPISNTFQISARAAQYLDYSSEQELLEAIAAGKLTTPYLHVGAGSNLLFMKDFEGVVLHSSIKGITVTAETDEWVELKVGAGMVFDDFVATCVERAWYGAENLSLIPGEVGASAVQNIGAYGVEAKDLICKVETISCQGEKRVFASEACAYAYRDSIFKRPEMKNLFVTYVHFRLKKKECYKLDYGTIRQELEGKEVNLHTVRQAIMDIRRSKLPDPAELGNAGSFFMNPIVSREKFMALQADYPNLPFYEVDEQRVKIPAAWMIDQCGWKGKSLGPAAVHHKQALVLVNLGGATGADIVALSDAVRASVYQRFGVDIHPEVNFIG